MHKYEYVLVTHKFISIQSSMSNSSRGLNVNRRNRGKHSATTEGEGRGGQALRPTARHQDNEPTLQHSINSLWNLPKAIIRNTSSSMSNGRGVSSWDCGVRRRCPSKILCVFKSSALQLLQQQIINKIRLLHVHVHDMFMYALCSRCIWYMKYEVWSWREI
jgi:hypothetical protein